MTYVGNYFSAYCIEQKHLQLMEDLIELQALYIEKPDYKNLCIFNAYRPPSGDDDTFFEKLGDQIGKVDRNQFEMWILGDLNANTRDRNCHAAKGLFDLCRETSVRRLIEDVTRPNDRGNGGSCLDHIVTLSAKVEF